MGAIWSQERTASVPFQRRPADIPLVTASSGPAVPPMPREPVVVGSKRKREEKTPPKQEDQFDTTEDGLMHKFKVTNVPVWFNKSGIEQQLAKVDGFPPYRRLLKLPQWNYFFIEFHNVELAKVAAELLRKTPLKGRRMRVAEVHTPSKKRRRIARSMQNAGKNRSLVHCKDAGDVTAPWRNIPYDEQIEKKKKLAYEVLEGITEALKPSRGNPGPPLPWVEQVTKGDLFSKVTCCPLEDFICAEPGVEGGRDYYRNKTEFTVGYTLSECAQGHDFHVRKPVAGYSVGSIRKGETWIGPVTDGCMTTSANARLISNMLSQVIESLTEKYPVYDRITHKGYWRQILIRESRNRSIAVVISTNPEGMTKDDESYAQSKVVDHLLKSLTGYDLSVLWHHHESISAVSSSVEVVKVHGPDSICERLLGVTFRIHPFSFFQVNTVMAEKMYTAIADMACLSPSTIVLDVCCGTGSIGLCLAWRACRVIGIEINEAAVEDAKFNAKSNGISNASYVTGRAEDVIQRALDTLYGCECVAILDPPRAGLHPNVIKAIRKAKEITRVVYAACEPTNLWKSALSLCRRKSKGFKGQPFTPLKAIGCDMFPHTKHYELLMSFGRPRAQNPSRKKSAKMSMDTKCLLSPGLTEDSVSSPNHV